MSDLRRVKTRDLAEVIGGRAGFLAESDRLLLEAVYVHDRPTTELAVATGIKPRVLRRRVKNLVARVLHPAYAVVLLRRDAWSKDMKAVGTAIFVEGLTLRAAGPALGLTYHAVRSNRDAILAMVHEERARRAAASAAHAAAATRGRGAA